MHRNNLCEKEVYNFHEFHTPGVLLKSIDWSEIGKFHRNSEKKKKKNYVLCDAYRFTFAQM